MALFKDEKTEAATPKRREEARRKGQVARTKELPSAMIILTSCLVFYLCGYKFSQDLVRSSIYYWGDAHVGSINLSDLHVTSIFLIKLFLGLMTPFFLGIVFISIVSNVIQFGLLFSTDALMPDFSRINPLTGLKHLFSLSSLVEVLKSFIKLFIISYLLYRIIAVEIPNLSLYAELPVAQLFIYLFKISLKIFFYSGLALLGLSLFDYMFQKYQYEQNLKMTKEEVKEEFKQREGDPKIKSKIKSIQRQMAMSRMMESVPKSDVVITNPVRIAVALRYDSKEMDAPKVIAKGYGFIAVRIKEVARKHSIPIVENKWLAQMLYKTVEINQYIPSNLYHAVAEILAYVYRLKNKNYEIS